MTNTINNVPRELLADLLGNDHDKRIMAERHLLAMLANAPSPAGVDGLGNTAKLLLPALRQYMHNDGSGLLAGYDLETTQAIIDGLRGENEALQAQVKVLQSDANSWQSGYDEGRRMGGKHCALTIDQQAQRIGELTSGIPRIMEASYQARRQRDQLAKCLKFARTTMAVVADNANLRGVEHRSLIAEIKRIDAALASGHEVPPCPH